MPKAQSKPDRPKLRGFLPKNSAERMGAHHVLQFHADYVQHRDAPARGEEPALA
jgi:hypothetical protein